ncbi:flagellar hook-length control protein FliK [Leptospira interrogans]|uniref:Flagellar hook-length control protein FliK n=1 Tax=Leptospira interrogans TaxID=173 RepID=A0AAV9FTB4_LEPIR|nr:flagellar hook-length control protein FliK [Leptospira interrogans]EJP03026.1 flagellar hook-length control protein FliK [Leptospira interrogans serovar Bulgarica str. Mallika]KAK2619139.1 flagellar hook-length control protein FliK [Leptospira interrogans]UID82400.1 flagellar hook-length control protein FliK [Leptospira interrogans]WOT12351.1 flagellar hook-length control protein FliK [Leptospira interrogans]
MNISGDLSVSEFKPQQSMRSLPKMGEVAGKNSFVELMKFLQGSAQKGLEETLAEIQNTSSKAELPQPEEEDPEIIEEKKRRSINSIEEEISKEENFETTQEAPNANILPWFLVSETKTNESVDPEIESVILDELQSEIIKTNSTETLNAPESISTSELIENFFANEVEESTKLLSEVSLKEELENLLDTEKGSLVSFENLKEIKARSTKQESEIYEKSESFEAKDSFDTFRFNEVDKKESKENIKGLSNSFKDKDFEEAKVEVSKELALDSEKWKISRDKKTDSYTNLKTAAKEEIKAVVLNQFTENSFGKSGQEQSFRSDSYSSLVKGVGTTAANGSRESGTFSKEFLPSKESNVLSKKDIQQNFQNLIRSARVQILENGRTEASIRMNPKDLGQMSLAISTDKDVVRGKLLVESDTVKQQLVAELANLKQDLKANGLELESLVIEVKEREDGFSFNADSDKNGKDSRSFQAAFGEDWNSDFKHSFYEEDELSFEENFSEPNDFPKKTDGKSEKLLDLKV